MTKVLEPAERLNVLDDPSGNPLLTRATENPARRGPIVLALHGTETTRAPIVLAHRLARRLNVDLEVITVGEALAMPADLGVAPVPVLCQDFTPIQEDVVRQKVRDVCGDTRWRLTLRYGSMAREIASLAQELNATFIVVGAAPHRGLRHQVSGLRAMQVLRRAPSPVIAVAPDAGGLPRTMVAAIDFSPASIRAAEAGLLMLEDGGACILAHAPFPLPLRQVVEEHTGALLGADVADVFGRLRDELRPYLPPGATLQTRQLDGKVGTALLDLASAEQADVITIGRHSRNVIERFFVGSVASEVIHGATCSVLASPEPSAAEAVRLKMRMTDSAVEPDEADWADVLKAASERNAGRVVTLEENDRALGSQVQASGFVLSGIDYDPATRRVDVMLHRGDGARDHLTRTIEGVSTIGVKSDKSGRDQAVEVVHGESQTLLYFEP